MRAKFIRSHKFVGTTVIYAAGRATAVLFNSLPKASYYVMEERCLVLSCLRSYANVVVFVPAGACVACPLNNNNLLI